MNAERFEQVHGIKKGRKDVMLLYLCFQDTPAPYILPSTNNRVLDKPHKLIEGIIAGLSPILAGSIVFAPTRAVAGTLAQSWGLDYYVCKTECTLTVSNDLGNSPRR